MKYILHTCHLDAIFALSLILGPQNVQFCVICFVASTRGLIKRTPLPTRFRHQRYQHLSKQLLTSPFKIQEELTLLLVLYDTDFFQNSPQNIRPSLSIVRETVCFTIHDVATGLKGVNR